MKILHGTWIPQTETGFIQQGRFYLWVETTETKQRKKASKTVHPHHLFGTDLTTFLSQELGIKASPPSNLEKAISPQFFLLPSTPNQPLPSLELARYLEAELPETFAWKYWQIACYQRSPLLLRLNRSQM
ncbi:MAG: hypothetical protein HC772_09135 [Leptolyngbyaceae cyanobacterium CRU_2_3]|nr:hypothetical protein [Leptolyngbyaceae cyanobacterium CRU_2_3]